MDDEGNGIEIEIEFAVEVEEFEVFEKRVFLLVEDLEL